MSSTEMDGSRDLDWPGDEDPPQGLDGLLKGHVLAVKHPTYALDSQLPFLHLYRPK